MNCTLLAEVFTGVKVTDLAVAFASLIAAWVAVSGLSAWRHQLKGKTEYDLAKRILLSLFKYRDAIHGVRNPMMWGHEMPSPPEEKRQYMGIQEIRYYGTEKAYQKRWDRVTEHKAKLYPELLEGEVIWGTELNERFKKIYKLQAELQNAVRRHLELSDPSTPQRKQDSVAKYHDKHRDILYDESFDESDEFSKDIESAIQNIEEFLKPKLEL
jgi:hypothetical protein